MGWVQKTEKAPLWTESEKDALQAVARYSPEVIHRKLKEKGYHRSVTAIVLQLKRQRCCQNLSGYSANALAQCLGIDLKGVTRLIELGKIPAKRRGTNRTPQQGGDMYWIWPSAIRQYLIEYLSEVDFRKVDKYWFVDMVTDPALATQAFRADEKRRANEF
jgi:hypothetical protein